MEPARHGDSLFGPGSTVGHFRISRLLGRGGMAEVYLARDLSLGRRVALKVVLPESIQAGSTLAKFLVEARITARFSHPHIVTIYEVGEHGGCPYIALEYLEGHTLKQRMGVDPPGEKEQLRIGLAIAEALCEAHQRKILHRDLKPQNIIIPKDGRLRVLDFGLAKMTAPPHGPTRKRKRSPGTGTPAYMSPERWRGEEGGEAADIWSLGIIFHELATGERPFTALSSDAYVMEVVSSDPVPKIEPSHAHRRDFADLIARCLDKKPMRRPSAAQLVAELDGMLHRNERRRLSAQRPPFRGLLPFSERHAELFYGRDAEIAAFLERLRDEAVLPVVGPSGAGKSSFVQAGVIPRLRERGIWTVLQLRPGTGPFRALAAKLIWEHSRSSTRSDTERTVRVGPPATKQASRSGAEVLLDEGEEQVAKRLYESPHQLNLIIHDLAETQGSRVLLFVDQLEELLTLGTDLEGRTHHTVARRFMQALCTAADDPREPVRIIFTLRDDYLVRLAQGPEALQALSRVTVIHTPERDNLEEILHKPLERVGYGYDDPDLPAEMIAAVRDEPACLPLLQFTSQLLWERRDKKTQTLRRADYDSLGGVAGALARHADGVVDRMSAQQKSVARELLLRLVTPDRARQVATRSQVLDGMGDEESEILDRLIGARLISVRKSRGEHDGETELELVHESLLKKWGRLARWIDHSREELAFIAEVSPTAELWHKRGRHDEELWDGAALGDALRMRERLSGRAPDLLNAFLEAGRAKQLRTSRRKRGLIAGAIVVLSVVAIALATQNREVGRQRDQARELRRQADAEREQAQMHWAEAQREGARAALLQTDPLEARAKLRGSLERQDSPLGRALWWRLSREPLRWKKDLGAVVHAVAFAPDGKTVAAACQNKTIALLDVETRTERFVRGHHDQVLVVAYSPDGAVLASASWSGELATWDLASGAMRRLEGHHSAIRALTFSPDGRLLASGGADKIIRLWDARTGKLVRSLRGHSGTVRALSFSPDGGLLASGSVDKTVRLWEVASGTEKRLLSGHDGDVHSVSFHPSGKAIASAGMDKTIRIWALDRDAEPLRITGHTAPVGAVAYAPDGRTLVSAGWDKTLRIWDAATGTARRVLEGHEAGLYSLALGPAGALVATGSWDDSVRLWDLRVTADDHDLAGHTGGVYGLAFGPDGQTLASGSLDRTIAIWDVASGRRTRSLVGHRNSVSGIAINPSGRWLASGSADETIGLWDLATGEQERLLVGHRSEVTDVAFGPDDTLLASTSGDKTVRLWDVGSGELLRIFRGHQGAVWGVSISADGKLVASAGDDKTVKLWRVRGPTSGAKATLRGHTEAVTAVAFHPTDRELLASGSDDHTIRLWNTSTLQSRILGKQAGRVYWLSFSPDGSWLGAPDSSGSARLWELATGRYVELVGHRAEVNFLRFSRDGKWVATSSDDTTVRVWHAGDGRPLWRAPVLLSNPPEIYTHRGWIRFDGSPPGPETAWRRALAEHARTASQSLDAKTVCLATHDGTIQLWDIAADVELRQWADLGRARVFAFGGGCASLVDGKLRLHARTGDSKTLSSRSRAVARSGAELLVSTDREIEVIDAAGSKLESQPAGVGVTALARSESGLLLGFADGHIERLPSRDRARLSFRDTPSSQVVGLQAGPMGTLIAGYASGALGLWSLSGGARLYLTRLHGPVVHLLLKDRKLYAATELGSYHAFDLSAFYLERCELLERVWKQVAVVWEDGHAVERPPPAEHPCRRR